MPSLMRKSSPNDFEAEKRSYPWPCGILETHFGPEGLRNWLDWYVCGSIGETKLLGEAKSSESRPFLNPEI